MKNFQFIVIERIMGEARVYNCEQEAKSRTALYAHLMDKYNMERIESITILSEREC